MTRPGGNTADDQVHYIRAGGTVAILTREVKKKSTVEKTRYLHKDQSSNSLNRRAAHPRLGSAAPSSR